MWGWGNGYEEHSFIGERFDASTGLLYLNARYYDPALGRFMQPDWWEVRKKGVGTNRYAYSNNDPVNRSDRNGHLNVFVGGAMDHATRDEPVGRFRSWLKRTFRGLFKSGEGVDDITGIWRQTNRRILGGHSRMAIQVQNVMEVHPHEPLNIFGHSRGGAAAIRLANELNSMGIVADFVMSIDPVAFEGNRETIDNGQTTWVNAYVPKNARVSMADRRQAGLSLFRSIDNPDSIARAGDPMGTQPNANYNYSFPTWEKKANGASGHMAIINSEGTIMTSFYRNIFSDVLGYNGN